ncbi:MAG: hypothetical protein ABUM51_07590 [Bacteroidota bacterium]
MKKILVPALVAGVLLFIISYGGLYLAVKCFPKLFVDYINPLFSSDGNRDLLFYLHAFVVSFALSWFWGRCKSLFKGYFLLRGIEFGLVYAAIALVPVMWITFSSLDITLAMVASWFLYGLCQAVVAGIIFAKLNP